MRVIMKTFSRMIRFAAESVRRVTTRIQRWQNPFRRRRTAGSARVGMSDHKGFLSSIYTDYDTRSREAIYFLLRHGAAYYSLSVFGFSFLVDRHPVSDSLYMATVAFTTIGYGDMFPVDTAGRVYFVVLATYGIAVLGIFLRIMGSTVADKDVAFSRNRKRKLHQVVLKVIGNNNAQCKPLFGPSTPLVYGIFSIVVNEAPIVLCVLFLGLLVGYHEGWGWTDSVYWTAVSSFTIGFGDLAPKSLPSRIFCIVFLPFSVAVIKHVLERIASLYMDRAKDGNDETLLRQTLTRCDIYALTLNNKGPVTRLDFLTHMLVALHLVSKEELDELDEVFDRLDFDKAGILNNDDLISTSTKLRAHRSKRIEHV